MRRALVCLLVLLAGGARAQDAVAPAPAEVLPEDLGALAEPPASALQLYGFTDLLVYVPISPADNPWLQVFNPHSAFSAGGLNLYLAATVAERVRSMAELRFTYAPNAAETVLDGSGEVARTRTDVNDRSEWGRIVRWGGVVIERAWAEYEVAPWLIVRAGRFLTPYGIWVVDHGSPTIIGIGRPYVIRSQMFPEHQTGFELHGRRYLGGDYTFGWHLTLSNGRGPYDAQLDTDGDKAIGGRVLVERRGDLEAELGASFYRGRYTDETWRWVPTGEPNRSRLEATTYASYDEMALAADLRLRWGGLRVNLEAIMNDRVYGDSPRPLVESTSDRLASDERRWGVYGLVGYQTPWLGLMPYALVEFYELGLRTRDAVGFQTGERAATLGDVPHLVTLMAGVNVRPGGPLVLKLELSVLTFPGAAPGSWGDHDTWMVQSQAAWVF